MTVRHGLRPARDVARETPVSKPARAPLKSAASTSRCFPGADALGDAVPVGTRGIEVRRPASRRLSSSIRGDFGRTPRRLRASGGVPCVGEAPIRTTPSTIRCLSRRPMPAALCWPRRIVRVKSEVEGVLRPSSSLRQSANLAEIPRIERDDETGFAEFDQAHDDRHTLFHGHCSAPLLPGVSARGGPGRRVLSRCSSRQVVDAGKANTID